MNYKGKIKNINHIVISDPSYEEGVWCRYERKNLNEKNWFVDLEINDVSEEYEGLTTSGTEFRMLLQPNRNNCEMVNDGIKYLKGINIDKFDIGMDTACIALGINEYAREIVNSHDEWQPECAMKTLTDGIFGEVMEGEKNDKLSFIFITGYLDKDTGYSKEDILDYISDQFQIEDLEKEKDSNKDKELI